MLYQSDRFIIKTVSLIIKWHIKYYVDKFKMKSLKKNIT